MKNLPFHFLFHKKERPSLPVLDVQVQIPLPEPEIKPVKKKVVKKKNIKQVVKKKSVKKIAKRRK